jgi:hypothetical protein
MRCRPTTHLSDLCQYFEDLTPNGLIGEFGLCLLGYTALRLVARS